MSQQLDYMKTEYNRDGNEWLHLESKEMHET